jgi:hypothetical protein
MINLISKVDQAMMAGATASFKKGGKDGLLSSSDFLKIQSKEHHWHEHNFDVSG